MTFYLSPSFLSLPFSQFLTLLKLSFLAVMMGIPVVLYFPISSTQLRSKTLRKPQNMTVCACLLGLQLQLEQQQQQHHSFTACLLTYEQETAERSVCVCVCVCVCFCFNGGCKKLCFSTENEGYKCKCFK